MTGDDTVATREILKARRRADYQRYKEAMRERRAQHKQKKAAARQQEKEQNAAQLRQLIKPAAALENGKEDS